MLSANDGVVGSAERYGEHQVGASPSKEHPVLGFGEMAANKARRNVLTERPHERVRVRDGARGSEPGPQHVAVHAVPALLTLISSLCLLACVLLPGPAACRPGSLNAPIAAATPGVASRRRQSRELAFGWGGHNPSVGCERLAWPRGLTRDVGRS